MNRRHLAPWLLMMAACLSPTIASAGQLPLPSRGQLVVYDHADSKLQRAVAGTLVVEDGFIRYRALNRSLTWDIDLRDVEGIRSELVIGPGTLRIPAIVIETREGNEILNRRVVPVDQSLGFLQPAAMAASLRQAWERVSGSRTTVSARRR